MMKLSTLWALDRTVDPATGRSPVADAVAANWDHDPGTVRFFRSSANFLYTLERNGCRAYLRIAAASERAQPEIAAEVALLDRLHRGDLPVVQALPDRTGELVVTRDTAIGPVHAVLFDRLPGRHRDLDELSLVDVKAWGAAVGRLHLAMKDAPASCHHKVPSWRAAFDAVDAGTVSVPDPVRRESRRLQAFLRDIPVTPDTYGLLHGDLELDNLAWDGDAIATLDFDEYGHGWYLLDLAKALTDPLRAGDTLASPRIVSFVAGYRRHHPLDDGLLACLPGFLALSEFRSYVALARAIDVDGADAGTGWLRDLIRRLRGWMHAYERGLERPGP